MQISIERTGGLAGFGGPGGRVKSRADFELDELAPADRDAVAALFRRGPGGAAPSPDAFVYVLTRSTPAGTEEVHALEHEVPRGVLKKIKTQVE